jgi:hypothetical protein
LAMTQARDTATLRVRFARAGGGAVIPSHARDPGVASGGDSSPAARNDNRGVAAWNDEARPEWRLVIASEREGSRRCVRRRFLACGSE